MPDRPTVTCLCGSTRFRDAFESAMRSETLAGKIVLTVGLFGHLEGLDMDGPTKRMLDELHCHKIDLANEILVISDESGYIGSSTFKEIQYACATGKSVRWLHQVAEERYRALAQREEAVRGDTAKDERDSSGSPQG